MVWECDLQVWNVWGHAFCLEVWMWQQLDVFGSLAVMTLVWIVREWGSIPHWGTQFLPITNCYLLDLLLQSCAKGTSWGGSIFEKSRPQRSLIQWNFSSMEQNFHWIQRTWWNTEAWIGLNLKILSLTCLAGTVVASWSFTQEVAGLSPFTVMTNVFVTEFSETFRKNSNVNTCSFTELSMWNIKFYRYFELVNPWRLNLFNKILLLLLLIKIAYV